MLVSAFSVTKTRKLKSTNFQGQSVQCQWNWVSAILRDPARMLQGRGQSVNPRGRLTGKDVGKESCYRDTACESQRADGCGQKPSWLIMGSMLFTCVANVSSRAPISIRSLHWLFNDVEFMRSNRNNVIVQVPKSQQLPLHEMASLVIKGGSCK